MKGNFAYKIRIAHYCTKNGYTQTVSGSEIKSFLKYGNLVISKSMNEPITAIQTSQWQAKISSGNENDIEIVY